MKNLEKVNFFLIQKFNESYEEDKDSYNNITKEESKQLDLLQFIIEELNIIPKRHIDVEKANIPIEDIKPEMLIQPYICKGGTCSAGICKNIGYITTCDSGCTYPGA